MEPETIHSRGVTIALEVEIEIVLPERSIVTLQQILELGLWKIWVKENQNFNRKSIGGDIRKKCKKCVTFNHDGASSESRHLATPNGVTNGEKNAE